MWVELGSTVVGLPSLCTADPLVSCLASSDLRHVLNMQADRHAQTVLGSVLNDLDNFSVFQLPIKTRRVLLISDHDGQHINLDWYESTESAKAGGNAGGGVGGGTGDGDGAGGAGVPVTSSAARAASTASAAEEKCDEADRSPIIILIHGIAGNSQEGSVHLLCCNDIHLR